jgi:hypothetical protein
MSLVLVPLFVYAGEPFRWLALPMALISAYYGYLILYPRLLVSAHPGGIAIPYSEGIIPWEEIKKFSETRLSLSRTEIACGSPSFMEAVSISFNSSVDIKIPRIQPSHARWLPSRNQYHFAPPGCSKACIRELIHSRKSYEAQQAVSSNLNRKTTNHPTRSRNQ